MTVDVDQRVDLEPPADEIVEAGDTHLTCPIDNWTFDASVTEGKCPICGWAPAGAAIPPPAWIRFTRWVDWDLAGLFGLLLIALVLGVVVAQAVHLSWNDLNPAR